MTNKHIVCFSGGEGSALVAVEVQRKYGTENLILLNHDISENVEDADVKRFKQEVADYCGVPITYANMPDWDKKTQFDVVVEAGAFKVGNGTALCTNRMKTAPFDKWLNDNQVDETCVIYYGFDKGEQARILRRASIMAAKGYRTDFPLAFWPRTIQSTREIGIEPPLGYAVFKHANCVGCLKAGMQHWYVVYCMRPDIWEKGKWSEEEIGYSIIKGHYLLDLEPKFARMKELGIEPTEKLLAATFWARAKKILDAPDDSNIPCECAA
jgi:hypothetical protein